MIGPDEDDRLEPAPLRSPEGDVWFALMALGLLVSALMWSGPFVG